MNVADEVKSIHYISQIEAFSSRSLNVYPWTVVCHCSIVGYFRCKEAAQLIHHCDMVHNMLKTERNTPTCPRAYAEAQESDDEERPDPFDAV